MAGPSPIRGNYPSNRVALLRATQPADRSARSVTELRPRQQTPPYKASPCGGRTNGASGFFSPLTRAVSSASVSTLPTISTWSRSTERGPYVGIGG
jgi:hypothetical protein